MPQSITLHLPSLLRPAGLPPSPRARDIATRFGIENSAPARLLRPQKFRLQFPSLTLLTGPSGSGKSTLLRRLLAALRARNHKIADLTRVPLPPLPADRSVADCFPLPLDETLALLSRAGLAEPRLWLRAPAQLSEGEQFRFRLARALASPAKILAADEFAALLDRPTARALAWQFARAIRATNRAALLATSHEDLAHDLQPDVKINIDITNNIYVTHNPIKLCESL